MRPAQGVTLVELLAVLLVLGLMLGVSGLALGSLRMPKASQSLRDLEQARAAAIRTGVPTSAKMDSMVVRFLPDGRALGPGVDPLTGEPHAVH